jgi:hypothetical protein
MAFCKPLHWDIKAARTLSSTKPASCQGLCTSFFPISSLFIFLKIWERFAISLFNLHFSYQIPGIYLQPSAVFLQQVVGAMKLTFAEIRNIKILLILASFMQGDSTQNPIQHSLRGFHVFVTLVPPQTQESSGGWYRKYTLVSTGQSLHQLPWPCKPRDSVNFLCVKHRWQ